MNKKKVIALITVIMCAFVLVGGTVLAAVSNTAEKADSANNVFFGGEEANIEGGLFFGGYGAGKDVKVNNSKSEDSIALAGMDIAVSNTKAGGSVYLAGQTVTVTNTQSEGNLFMAAQKLAVDKNSSFNGVYMTGQEAVFDGSAKALSIAAADIAFNGNIQGDATIEGENVVIGKDAVVSGTLKIESSQKPQIADGAKIGDLKVKIVKKASEPTMGQRMASGLLSALYWAVAMLILGLLLMWIGRRHMKDAAVMVKERTGAMLGSGAVGLIAIPIAAVLFLITIIGMPVSAFLILVYALVILCSTAFTGASLGPVVFKKMSPVAAGIIGIIILAILKELPYIGWLFSLGAFIYTLGFLIQKIYIYRQERKRAKLEKVSKQPVIPEIEEATAQEQTMNEQPVQNTAMNEQEVQDQPQQEQKMNDMPVIPEIEDVDAE